ncbi:MAG: pyridoxamine 5'-phosphate oxidase family protein [Desulfobacteraceae bacterium]|nr:pyridoxamine 5'-phosphate oxidase family protein [Desulfobacteraceae bacterium]MBC2756867.1 pyridoxamine 5'-phosphate oxidase family protein [Desulfobacteraceae bacterium]
MRRKEKEITERSAIEAVIFKSTVCRLGLSGGKFPYVVPMCFGYKDSNLYLHGALKGRKIDTIKENPNVCVEFESHAEIVKAEIPCNWGMKYQSVISFGKAELLQSLDEKRKALNVIMRQYYDRTFVFEDAYLTATAVIRIEVQYMTGRQSGF